MNGDNVAFNRNVTSSISIASKHRTAKRLVRRLDVLGYAVMLRPKLAT